MTDNITCGCGHIMSAEKWKAEFGDLDREAGACLVDLMQTAAEGREFTKLQRASIISIAAMEIVYRFSAHEAKDAAKEAYMDRLMAAPIVSKPN